MHLSTFHLLLLLVGGVVILVLGIHLEEGIRGHAAWHRYETEAKQRGVKLEFAAFVPPKIPDAENFASIPIFEAVFSAAGKKQDIPNPFKLPKAANGSFPKFGDSNRQAVVDLAVWQTYFAETKRLPLAGNDAGADVLKALEHYAEPLAQLHAAGARPHCRFPVDWEKGIAASLPHITLLFDAARLYALRLDAHLAVGNSTAAYEDFHDSLRLVTATADEPSLLAGIIRLNSAEIMENAVWDGLATHRWEEPELRKIEAELAALDWLKDYLLMIGSERGAFNAVTDRWIAEPRTRADAIFSWGMRRATRQDKWGYTIYPAGWIYQSKVRGNRYFDEMSARIDPIQRRWFQERPAPSAAGNTRSAAEMTYYLAFYLLASGCEMWEEKSLRLAALTDEARLACALERFRQARGSFPATLQELVPEFLPVIPVQIVNGQPYLYRLTEDGSFVLYSVGSDLRDDGGTINPATNASKQLDWVWRYPAKIEP